MTLDLAIVVRLVLLLALVNAAPIIARNLLHERLARPLDGGRRLADGRALLGSAKTVRGVLAGVLGGALGGLLLGWPATWGALFGALSMAGDLLSSFAKRRLGVAASDSVIGLDQGPEALLPLLAMAGPLGLSVAEILACVVGFTVVDLVVSPLLFRLHIRRRPR